MSREMHPISVPHTPVNANGKKHSTPSPPRTASEREKSARDWSGSVKSGAMSPAAIGLARWAGVWSGMRLLQEAWGGRPGRWRAIRPGLMLFRALGEGRRVRGGSPATVRQEAT